MSGAFNGDRIVEQEVIRLIEKFNVKCVIETGTYKGQTTQFFAKHVPQVHTIEINSEVLQEAKSNFQKTDQLLSAVKFHHGSSQDILATLLPELMQSIPEKEYILFYLDAHWHSYWPLKDELKLIAQFCQARGIVVIDDFKVPNRNFLFDSYNGKPNDIEFIWPELSLLYHNNPNYAVYYNDFSLRDCCTVGKLYVVPHFEGFFTDWVKQERGILYSNLESSTNPIMSETNNFTREQAEKLLFELYTRNATEPSDIYEHMPILLSYASNANSILEAGVRIGVSTSAFLSGLYSNNKSKVIENEKTNNLSLVSIDLEDCRNVQMFTKLSKSLNIQYKFWKGNDLLYPIDQSNPSTFDIVFIDTWHCYGQCKRELEKFAPVCKQFFILHDTTIDEYSSESTRLGWDVLKQHQETGFPLNEIVTGLWPAVCDFLTQHKEFTLEKRLTNNNGLTILKRVQPEHGTN